MVLDMRLALVLLVAACGSKAEGLPPSSSWSDDPTNGVELADRERPKLQNPHGDEFAAPDHDPHRDVPGAPPLTGGEMPHDHGDEDVQPPHAIDPEPAANNPATRVRGTLVVAPQHAGRLQPDGIVFLIAKAADAAGQPSGTARAVGVAKWKANGMPFELGGANGEVIVIARYDQDGDGSTTQAGDVIGMTRVKIPADNVVIAMDKVIP